MPLINHIYRKTLSILDVYWMLVRVTVPVAILTELLSRLGAIKAVAPYFAPLMNLVGLPPELGLAWLTGAFIGIWGAVPLVFSLAPASSLTVADVTVFSALILFMHGLPVEQQIIRKAGPGLVATTMLRLAGGVSFALLLHWTFHYTGWLSAPVMPSWIPIAATTDWIDYFRSLAEAMMWMLLVLTSLSWGLDFLKWSGLLGLMMKVLSPALRLAGIRGEASHLTAVGLFLGISYGAGLLVQEARRGNIPPRQIFLACIFMCFAHSIIEDTLILLALGANVYAILVARLVFAVAATALIAAVIRRASERFFFARAFAQAETSNG